MEGVSGNAEKYVFREPPIRWRDVHEPPVSRDVSDRAKSYRYSALPCFCISPALPLLFTFRGVGNSAIDPRGAVSIIRPSLSATVGWAERIAAKRALRLKQTLRSADFSENQS